MILQGLSVCLAAVLFQCAVQVSANIESLKTSNADQQMEITDKHNDLRRNVKPTPSNMLKMTWNSEIAENAQRWADQCTLTHSTQDSRKIGDRQCGENLYMSSRPDKWSAAIQAWYDEIQFFKYGVGLTKEGEVVGHFTQVVSYRSSEVGCAVAYCPHQKYNYYYVCQYCPGGNIVGKEATPYKAGTPCGDCPQACDNGLCTNPCRYRNEFSNCASLKNMVGCDHPLLKKDCKGVCKCTTEIQ